MTGVKNSGRLLSIALFALAPALACAATYRAGLLQSKWSAANDWTTVLPLAVTERTPGVVMAHVYASEANCSTVGYSNAWSGAISYWNKQNTMFGYTGQMWMEAGKTYTFGKCLDDSARIEIDGTQVMQHTSWDQWTTATYAPSFTGWHDVDIRVSDGSGGKGPSNKNGWGTTRGLGWNTKGVTTANLTDWNWFIEDGVTNRFRCLDTNDFFAVVSRTKTATGFDFTLTNLSDAAVSVAAYRSSSADYAAAASWTPEAAPVSIPAGGTAVLSLATADDSPAAYQLGSFGTGADADWFVQFVPFGPIGFMSVSGVEGQSVAASGTVVLLGEGANSARIRVEAAVGPGFSEILAASQEVTIADEGGTAALALDGLSFGSTYYLRLRIVTSTGTVYAPYSEPVTTLDAPFSPTKVYAAGLIQAQIGGSAMDRTTDVLSHSTATNVPGTIMASTSGSAANPYNGKTYSWANNTTFGYVGQMWMEEGTTYWFGKYIDDSGDVTVDGVKVMQNDTYNALVTASCTPTKTGWHDVEFRFGNGSGGAGCMNSTIGFGFNTDGVSSFSADTFKDGGAWSKAVDPGDLSLLRCVYSATPFMTVESVVPSGGDLVVTLSCAGVPEGGGVLQALWGAGSGGYATSAWAHAESVGSVAAGDTASASFTVAGAGSAAFAAFRLVNGDGASIPWVQWSEIYNLSAESPVFGLVNTLVDYTNLAYTASCSGLGAGATSVEASLEIATDPDFRNLVRTVLLDELVGIGGQSVALTGFTTNTTYYARVVGENSQGETGASGPVIVTTLDPQPPEGVSSFSGRGFTTLTGTALVSTFGTGSDSASIRFEASTDGFATIAGASADVAATVGTGALLAIPGLAPATAHSLRLRIENEWGLVTCVPVAGTFSTREAPLSASGIGYSFSPDGSTVDLSFGVTEVFDGATCTAELEYDGRTLAARNFSAAGTLSWPDVAAAAGAADATVTVTSVVGGTTYSQTWTLRVRPGAESHALSSLAELSDVVFRVGDSATLPELAGADDYYVVLDVRSFSLGADGVTLVALEPGFSAVAAMEWDATAGAFVRNENAALAVCIPEPQGAGRIFLAKKQTGDWNWCDASKWTNLTDGTADYPRLADDVAVVPMPKRQILIGSDVTVGAIYIGQDATSINNGSFRLTGNNSATLTFRRSSGKPGLLRITGLARYDVVGGYVQIYLGGGSGNKTTGLAVEMPGGLDLDGGDWPDWADTATRAVSGRCRYILGQPARYWNIPAGKTFRIFNTYGYTRLTGDDQGGNANVTWENDSQFTGSGTFFYDGVASTYFDNPFYAFEGTVAVRNKQKYDGFSFGSRGGSFWMVNWTRPTQFATNATLLVEGGVAYSGNGIDLSKGFGAVSYGNSHGYGSWGWEDNALPARKWIMNGGSYRASAMNNNAVSWREDGTTATQPVCVPNGAETLVVSNGFSVISLGQNGDADRPTNSVAFARLEHAGDGVLLVGTDRTFGSYSGNNAGANWRVRAVLGGFHDHAIGGTGHAASRHGDASVRTNLLETTAPIVPWIVSDIQYGFNLYFPGADDETDEIVSAGYAPDLDLDAVADPTANAKGYGKSVALTADKTVNSFVVQSNTGAGKENLGAGRTLTITSGGLILSNNNQAKLGNEAGGASGEAGTVVFPNKAYVYSTRQSESQPNEIWAKMVSPHGAVFSYPGDLRIGGDQTGIDGHIAVNGTRLQLGSASNGCEIDVPVHLHGLAKLTIGKQDSFCRQTLHLWTHGTDGPVVVPPAGAEEQAWKLYIDGKSMLRGTYGSSSSGADNVDDVHFSGTGILRVRSDDRPPSVMVVR